MNDGFVKSCTNAMDLSGINAYGDGGLIGKRGKICGAVQRPAGCVRALFKLTPGERCRAVRHLKLQ